MDRAKEDWRTNRLVINEICRNLDLNSILSLRLVCKDWYKGSQGVFAKKAAINLTIPDSSTKKVNLKVDTLETHELDPVLRYINFIKSNNKFRCENLKMALCPQMKYFPIWLTIGPTIKNFVVFPHHERDVCNSCSDWTTFVTALLQMFPNLESLAIEKSIGTKRSLTPGITFKLPAYPDVEKFQCLKRLTFHTDSFDLPQEFVKDHLTQLESLALHAYTEDETKNEQLYKSLTDISLAVQGTGKQFKTLELSCRHRNFESGDILQDWFARLPSKEIRLTFSVPFPEVLLAWIPDLPQDRKIWLSIRVPNFLLYNHDFDLVRKKRFLDRIAWTRTFFGYELVACHPDAPEQRLTLSKNFFPDSSLQSLCIGANALADIEQLIQLEKLVDLLPTATFMCVRQRGQIKAEVFGPPRLLFANLKNLINFTIPVVETEKHVTDPHLLDFVEFRRIVGIPGSWSYTGFESTKILLVFFSLDFKLINEARLKLSTFVYPEKKLVDTYQIFQGYQNSKFQDESQGKVVLNWADPICLELASGKPMCEGTKFSYKVLKTET